MSRTTKFLEIAEAAARRSKSRVRVGAVIADGRRILSIGVNDMTKTHPMFFPANLHAELDAIIGAPYTEGCDVYVVRLLRDGTRAAAKPCHRCQRILDRYGVRRVFST